MKILGFAGYSGAGKTTLIEQLIPRSTKQGLRVSLIKHARHAFDIDKPGKDSFRHREAGASEVMLRVSSWDTLNSLMLQILNKFNLYVRAQGKQRICALFRPGLQVFPINCFFGVMA
jgi:molybdopterin-guanine dinucleotide biosynthesis protein MobB